MRGPHDCHGSGYLPPSSDKRIMLDHLKASLISAESFFPGCGIFVTGDFNHLQILRLLSQSKMKQLVHTPTRGDNTLNLIATNICSKLMTSTLFISTLLLASRITTVSFFGPKRGPPTLNPAGKLTVTKRYLSSID